MGKAFAVTSGKGGVGKSTFSANLGLEFAKQNKKTLLIDLDEGLRCLDIMLNIDKTAVFDLADLLSGKEMEDCMYKCDFQENLYLIPAPQKVGRINTAALSDFYEKALQEFDIVIFDFPAGIHPEYYKAIGKETLFLTVAINEPVSIRDANFVGETLNELGFEARLIINRFVYKLSLKKKYKNIDAMIDSVSLQLLGIIPESEELALFSMKHKLKKNGRAKKAMKRIISRLQGEHILLPKAKKI